MTNDATNPYASPTLRAADPLDVAIDPVAIVKAKAIIKDAGQFWIAILLCIFCTGLGAIIIGPWYLIRLVQWSSLARSQPMLVDPNVPHGSIAQRFQSAKPKLIIGICFGAAVLLLVALAMASLIATARR